MNLSLEDIAGQAVKSYPGDRDKAARQFVILLKKHPSLASEALYRLGRLLVNEMSRALHYSEMSRELPKIANKIRQDLGGLIYAWPMGSGGVLSEATTEDINKEIEHLEGIARGISVRVRFMRKLLCRMSPGQKVKDVWTNDEVETLMSRISNDRKVEM